MERAEKIKLLRRYNDIEKTILELNERYLELYTASTKITPSYGKEGSAPSGFTTSKVENNCIKLLEIDIKGQHYISLIRRVDNAMKGLTVMQRCVVTYIDIDSHSMYQCAKHFKGLTTISRMCITEL